MAAISVGTPVAAARQVLAEAEIAIGGPKPFAAHPDGDQWLFYTLKEGHADLVIQYSPSENRVTGIAIHYATSPRSRTEIAVPASSIQFHEDGSYSVEYPSSAPRSKQTAQAKNRAGKTPSITDRADASKSSVPVESIGEQVLLAGRLGHPLATMLTVSGSWSFPDERAKDYTIRFIVSTVNGTKLATPVLFPVHSVNVANSDGVNAIPPHARHKELDGVTWTIRAFETGRLTQVPVEYWRLRGAPAMPSRPPFASELVGFLRPPPQK